MKKNALCDDGEDDGKSDGSLSIDKNVKSKKKKTEKISSIEQIRDEESRIKQVLGIQGSSFNPLTSHYADFLYNPESLARFEEKGKRYVELVERRRQDEIKYEAAKKAKKAEEKKRREEDKKRREEKDKERAKHKEEKEKSRQEERMKSKQKDEIEKLKQKEENEMYKDSFEISKVKAKAEQSDMESISNNEDFLGSRENSCSKRGKHDRVSFKGLRVPNSWKEFKEGKYTFKIIEEILKNKKHYNCKSELMEDVMAEAIDGTSALVYPARLVKYTLTKPSLSYSPNPKRIENVFLTRKLAEETLSSDILDIIEQIWNSMMVRCPEIHEDCIESHDWLTGSFSESEGVLNLPQPSKWELDDPDTSSGNISQVEKSPQLKSPQLKNSSTSSNEETLDTTELKEHLIEEEPSSLEGLSEEYEAFLQMVSTDAISDAVSKFKQSDITKDIQSEKALKHAKKQLKKAKKEKRKAKKAAKKLKKEKRKARKLAAEINKTVNDVMDSPPENMSFYNDMQVNSTFGSAYSSENESSNSINAEEKFISDDNDQYYLANVMPSSSPNSMNTEEKLISDDNEQYYPANVMPSSCPNSMNAEEKLISDHHEKYYPANVMPSSSPNSINAEEKLISDDDNEKYYPGNVMSSSSPNFSEKKDDSDRLPMNDPSTYSPSAAYSPTSGSESPYSPSASPPRTPPLPVPSSPAFSLSPVKEAATIPSTVLGLTKAPSLPLMPSSIPLPQPFPNNTLIKPDTVIKIATRPQSHTSLHLPISDETMTLDVKSTIDALRTTSPFADIPLPGSESSPFFGSDSSGQETSVTAFSDDSRPSSQMEDFSPMSSSVSSASPDLLMQEANEDSNKSAKKLSKGFVFKMGLKKPLVKILKKPALQDFALDADEIEAIRARRLAKLQTKAEEKWKTLAQEKTKRKSDALPSKDGIVAIDVSAPLTSNKNMIEQDQTESPHTSIIESSGMKRKKSRDENDQKLINEKSCALSKDIALENTEECFRKKAADPHDKTTEGLADDNNKNNSEKSDLQNVSLPNSNEDHSPEVKKRRTSEKGRDTSQEKELEPVKIDKAVDTKCQDSTEKTKEKSDETKNDKSTDRKERSSVRKRERSPDKKRDRTPEKRGRSDRSPDRRRVRSTDRRREHSADRHRNRSPNRRRERSPDRRRERTPERRERSPDRKRARSPERRRSERSPEKRRDRSPHRRDRSDGRRDRSSERRRERSIENRYERSPDRHGRIADQTTDQHYSQDVGEHQYQEQYEDSHSEHGVFGGDEQQLIPDMNEFSSPKKIPSIVQLQYADKQSDYMDEEHRPEWKYDSAELDEPYISEWHQQQLKIGVHCANNVVIDTSQNLPVVTPSVEYPVKIAADSTISDSELSNDTDGASVSSTTIAPQPVAAPTTSKPDAPAPVGSPSPPQSPARLSLDDRLLKEHGLVLHEEPEPPPIVLPAAKPNWNIPNFAAQV